MFEEQKVKAVVDAHVALNETRRDLAEARRDMLDHADQIEGCGFHAGKTLTNDDVMKLLRITFRMRELARGDR